ncbi:hypothetical protein C8R42DRAFT_648008 [Lentinula raphanica]|nr:hypothetical protein C8R42DRAFT_648008 [Lentinula raphanica]
MWPRANGTSSEQDLERTGPRAEQNRTSPQMKASSSEGIVGQRRCWAKAFSGKGVIGQRRRRVKPLSSEAIAVVEGFLLLLQTSEHERRVKNGGGVGGGGGRGRVERDRRGGRCGGGRQMLLDTWENRADTLLETGSTPLGCHKRLALYRLTVVES